MCPSRSMNWCALYFVSNARTALSTDRGALYIHVLERREGSAHSIEGAVVLELATQERPPQPHVWLEAVASAIAARRLAKGAFGWASQSHGATTGQHGQPSSTMHGDEPER